MTAELLTWALTVAQRHEDEEQNDYEAIIAILSLYLREKLERTVHGVAVGGLDAPIATGTGG